MSNPHGWLPNRAAATQFDRRLRPRFFGAKVTSDARLLADRELDDAFERQLALPRALFAAILGRIGRLRAAPNPG